MTPPRSNITSFIILNEYSCSSCRSSLQVIRDFYDSSAPNMHTYMKCHMVLIHQSKPFSDWVRRDSQSDTLSYAAQMTSQNGGRTS